MKANRNEIEKELEKIAGDAFRNIGTEQVKAPEGYFDELEKKVLLQIHAGQDNKKRNTRILWFTGLAAAAIMSCVWFGLQIWNTNNALTFDEQLAAIDYFEIEAWLDGNLNLLELNDFVATDYIDHDSMYTEIINQIQYNASETDTENALLIDTVMLNQIDEDAILDLLSGDNYY
jgi:hypothetical protein